VFPKAFQPYSWHTVQELSDGQRSGRNSLHLLQDHVDLARRNKGLAVKRKAPYDEEHPQSPFIVDQLASESSRSSPASDPSVDSLIREDDDVDVDCYNCRLIVEDDRITIHYVRSNQIQTRKETADIPHRSQNRSPPICFQRRLCSRALTGRQQKQQTMPFVSSSTGGFQVSRAASQSGMLTRGIRVRHPYTSVSSIATFTAPAWSRQTQSL